MTPEQPRTIIERVDYHALFPFLRLFDSFRIAIHPSRLLTALLAVVLIYLGGTMLDQMLDQFFGTRVYPGEVERYANLSPDEFRQWREAQPKRIGDQLEDALRSAGVRMQADEIGQKLDFDAAVREVRKAFAENRKRIEALKDQSKPESFRWRMEELAREEQSRIEAVRRLEPRGVFETTLDNQLACFEQIVTSSSALNFGFREALNPVPGSVSVVAALRGMLMTIPSWLWSTHTTFTVLYALGLLAVWSLLGGAVARSAALGATINKTPSITHAVLFAYRRWPTFAVAPLIPVILVAALAVLLLVGGFVFFNVPGLDVVGGLVFVVALVVGLAMAMTLAISIGGVGLVYPAVAVEGTDAFDAFTRSYSYVWAHPWRWLFYTVVSLVYGAITYLFVGAVIFLTLWLVQYCVGMGVIGHNAAGLDRFVAIMPRPRLGHLTYDMDLTALPWYTKASAVVVRIWVNLFIALLAAYAVSFYLTSQTWIYLLLRRVGDGAAFDEVHTELEPVTESSTPAQSAPDTVAPPTDSVEP